MVDEILMVGYRNGSLKRVGVVEKHDQNRGIWFDREGLSRRPSMNELHVVRVVAALTG